MKYKYKIYLLGACAALGAVAFAAQHPLQNIISSNSNTSVSIKNFPVGTKIDYKIITNGDTVIQGKEEVASSKLLKLPLPKRTSENSNSTLSYQLDISPPKDNLKELSSAETLSLLLKLNQDNGNISLSGSGLDEFSDITVNNGEKSKNITSDWAGIFASDSINNGNNQTPLELAFQNYGMGSDFSKLGSAKIEVFLGDANGSSRSKVRARYTSALIRMTEELSAVMVLQTEAIGMFFDATAQLKTQRKHQELQARAHKDYHPSDQMCRIGTFIRSVAHAESKAEVNKHALNRIMINQYLSASNSSADGGMQVNDIAEIDSYTKYYCDPRDNNAATAALCPPVVGPISAAKLDRLNKDIDYTRTLGNKLTLDVDFVGDSIAISSPLTAEETDVIALAKNLYFPNVFEPPLKGNIEQNPNPHYNSRSFAAKMNVAHSSFINIVGMKSNAPEGQATIANNVNPPPPVFGTGVPRESGQIGLQSPLINSRPAPSVLAEDAGWAYMKAMLREFGIADENASGSSDDEIDNLLGEHPSYYAQMEVLTKKIYQHPNFYTNLYDKPANVDRIGASIDAITLMHQRDRFDSLLRREMLTSVLLEDEISHHAVGASANIYYEMKAAQSQ